MTDPEFADATYVEPITPDILEKVIARERPDALLPTLGGQTALNAAIGLYEAGVLEKYGVELIGADVAAIERGENRELFKEIVAGIGGESARSVICHTMEEAEAGVATLGGYPVVVRPSFTMGGAGSGIAYGPEDLRRIAGGGLQASLTTEVLLEESIIGWKEYELELMRDRNDNVVVVCSIENFDPMGVHTGDSVTVAPSLTLTDREYQRMRDLGIAIIRAVGVDTGGCNIQFAVDPATGRMIVIEMNPRVSRSSALASKATGFPIAKIAAKLAIGYTLDEIPNDITRETPASFEPTLDYVVVKVPRFAFEKFPGADPTLTTTMKSVGEAMAIGRSFPEALQKALRSLERDRRPAVVGPGRPVTARPSSRRPGCRATAGSTSWRRRCARARPSRSCTSPPASTRGSSTSMLRIEEGARRARGRGRARRRRPASREGPRLLRPPGRGAARHRRAVRPSAAARPRRASGLQDRRHLRGGVRGAHAVPLLLLRRGDRGRAAHQAGKVLILGSGPNRIGQGIEFDYSCVHAALALREAGYETVMLNCNPETVSTDYDTSDRLYFEPLTLEDVLEVFHAESAAGPVAGVMVQLGGQTPLGLAQQLKDAGVPVVGTSPEAIDLAEDRGAFGRVLADAGLPAPRFGTATTWDEAKGIAAEIGYPVLVRPSYVLGGRGMEIVYDAAMLEDYIGRATQISPDHPVLVDRFLDDAVEIDVDALFDGEDMYLGGVMEHIEEAGIHSGDSRARCRPSPSAARTSSASASRPRRSPAVSACAACSTSSSRWPPTCSTCSRPTRARRGRCRSCPRPPPSRWPRLRRA